MSVREMNGDPGIWEKLSWADLSSQEQELWTVLGWKPEKWDRNEAPASTDKLWKDLSLQEQITPDIWDFTRISGTILRINNG